MTSKNRYRKKNRRNGEGPSFRVVSPPAADSAAPAGAKSADHSPPRRDNGGGVGKAAPGGKRKDFLYLPTDARSLLPTEFVQSAAQPYRLVSRDWRREIPHLFAVFFMVLLLYAFTSPHHVTLEDDGLFIANLKFFGVAHPPGYPVHTFLGGLFYHLLPFGSPAFKGHFFSGFAGAVACAAVYATTAMIIRGRAFAYLAGLAYGASRTFWSQAIIAEVYTLNAMLFFIILALCVAYSARVGRSGRLHRRLLFVIAYVYGLGMANHYPILLLGSTGLGLLVLSQLTTNILPNLPKAFAMLALGAAPPYAWMVWRSYDLTPANFYGPIETFDGFLFYILRSGYSGVDKQAGVGLEDKIAFARHLSDDMLWQFTPVGFFFVAVGFCAMARSRHNWMWLSLATSWFTSSVALVYLLDFKATFIWLAAFRVYHLLAFGIMAIWLAFGAAWTVDKMRRLAPFVARQQVGLLIVCVVVCGSVYAHWEMNNRRDYRWAHDLAMAKLNSVEPNSVLFTFDDLDLPVGYLHFVEGVRPDLIMYNDQGLVYGNRLYSPLIPDFPPEGHPTAANKATILRQFIGQQQQRPIYYHPQRRNLYQHPGFGSDFTGFLRRVNRENAQERVILSDSLRQWLNANIGLQPTDRWTRQQHYSTVAQLINAVLIASAHGFQLDDRWQEVIDRAREKNAMTRLITNLQHIGQMSEDDMRRELAWTDRFDIDAEELLDDKMKSHFFVLRAHLLRRLQNGEGEGDGGEDGGSADDDYEKALLNGLERRRENDNPALSPILSHYLRNERYCDFIAVTERFYSNPDDMPTELLRNLRQARQKADCAAASAA